MSKPIERGPIRVTEEQFNQCLDDNDGLCIRCRKTQSGCEPDARRYECECCGTKTVFGVEELLLMGWLSIVATTAEAEQIC